MYSSKVRSISSTLSAVNFLAVLKAALFSLAKVRSVKTMNIRGVRREVMRG